MEPETETETETATETEGTETDGGTETTRDDVDLDETVGERPEGIEVSSTELITDIDLIRVTGVIENTGNRTFEEVEVQVTLLDDNDEIIGQFFHDTEEAEVQSLEPGQQWEFSVDFPEEDGEDAVSYRIDVDTDIDQSVDYQETTATETA